MRRAALALALLVLFTLQTAAAAETSRRIHVHNAEGAFVLEERGPAGPSLGAAPLGQRDELLWQHNIPGFMYTSCAIMEGSVFAGLNNGASCPAEYYLAGSSGTPDWTFTGGENAVTAGGGYLALVEAVPAIAGVRLHVWQAGDPPTPLWEKDIPNCSAPLSCLRIADSGTLLALAVNTATSSKTFALDPLTGDLLSSYTAPAGEFARALRVTDDGSRIALRNGAVMHALDAATGAVLWTASARRRLDLPDRLGMERQRLLVQVVAQQRRHGLVSRHLRAEHRGPAHRGLVHHQLQPEQGDLVPHGKRQHAAVDLPLADVQRRLPGPARGQRLRR